MRLRGRRLLYLVHRWLGVLMCVFFAMWFASGVVVMYVGYPKLTLEERLSHLPPLDAGLPYLPPALALAAAGVSAPLDDLRLAVASRGRPVYLATAASPAAAPAGRRAAPGQGTVVIDALTGQRLGAPDEAAVLASAASFAGEPVEPSAYLGSIDEDAFTHSRGLDAHRPLHVVRLADAAQTRLYVSTLTGEVVRDASLTERRWNYVGAWIHWLYPLRGTALDRWWSDVVNGLSILGIALVVTGSIVGIWRWRFATPYRSGSHSPYPGRMMRWHHVTGLLFAVVSLTWIFSGLMSMNPARVLDSGAPALRTGAMHQGPLAPGEGLASPTRLLAGLPGEVKELRWVRALGRDVVLVSSSAGHRATLDATSGRSWRADGDALAEAAARLLLDPLIRVERLTHYDMYYYARAAHTMTGGGEKPLPVLRMVFADAHGTWVHVDPATGQVVNRLDERRRFGRWAFAMLHSWDWLPLLERRPLWDVVLIGLSAGGLALSTTAVVIGWRRLCRKLRGAAGLRTRRQVAGATAPGRRG